MVQVVSGEVQLEAFEAGQSPSTSWQEAEKEVRRAAGMGPFTAANMLQLLGHYAHIPCDSETMRHLAKHHGVTACAQGQLQEKAQQVVPPLPVLVGMLMGMHSFLILPGWRQRLQA